MDPRKTIVCDVDHTILFTKDRDYDNSVPNEPVCAKLREAHEKGWTIILHTARGMGRSGGNILSVKDEVQKEIVDFCTKHMVPFDHLILGKPWARYYVDDKGIRPDEFADLELDDVTEAPM